MASGAPVSSPEVKFARALRVGEILGLKLWIAPGSGVPGRADFRDGNHPAIQAGIDPADFEIYEHTSHEDDCVAKTFEQA